MAAAPPRPGQRGPKGSGRARPKARPRAERPRKSNPTMGVIAATPTDPEDALVRAPAPKKKQHLKMVPLNGASEGTYDDGFDVQGPGRSGSHGRAPGARPAAPMGAVGGPMMAPPMAGIQGPMVSGPVAAGPMPAGAMPTAGMGGMAGGYPEEPRTSSQRVLLLVMLLATFASGAVVLCALAVGYAMYIGPGDGASAQVSETSPTPAPPPAEDSGTVAAAPSPAPRATRPRTRNKNRTTRTTPRKTNRPPAPSVAPVAPTAPPPPPPPVAGEPAKITVKGGQFVQFSSINITCNDGAYRVRMNGSGALFTRSDVPTGASCRLNANTMGGGPARTSFTGGARTFNCAKSGASTVCR